MTWEPYVRIWREVERDREVAMLLADDYRQLCKVVHAAIEFSRWQERGQPGVPDTLYPMTYGQLDAWHEKWDELYANLQRAIAELPAVHEEASRS